MNLDEIYRQNQHDLNRIIIIQNEIIKTIMLTEEEKEKMKYATKLLKSVLEKQLFINAIH